MGAGCRDLAIGKALSMLAGRNCKFLQRLCLERDRARGFFWPRSDSQVSTARFGLASNGTILLPRGRRPVRPALAAHARAAERPGVAAGGRRAGSGL